MDVDRALADLKDDADAPLDVAELALHLARDEYADLDVEACLSEMAGMAHEAKDFMRGSLESKVHGLCRYLFHEMGFHGNVQEYYDPRNSYLNQVLDRKTGIPITLTVLAMAVAKRAGLEVAGIGLPGHFVARATANGSQVIFDPFHGGRPLTAQDCENLVQQTTGTAFKANAENLPSLPLRLLVLRMLMNLKAVYLQAGDFARAARTMERLRQLDPDDVWLRRDLGVSLVHAAQPGKAIEHLEAYLRALPEKADTVAVRAFLDRALTEVGRWN
jgi:regulator of sirC expression with transglutaminase-like and TPR domain